MFPIKINEEGWYVIELVSGFMLSGNPILSVRFDTEEEAQRYVREVLQDASCERHQVLPLAPQVA